MYRGDRVEKPLPAKGSKDRQRWECSCRAPLATRGSDDKGVYLQLPPGFDLHPKTKHYFKSSRPARRFNVREMTPDNEPVSIEEAERRYHAARNTDVHNRLRPNQLPVVVRCERCQHFYIIPSVGIPPG